MLDDDYVIACQNNNKVEVDDDIIADNNYRGIVDKNSKDIDECESKLINKENDTI